MGRENFGERAFANGGRAGADDAVAASLGNSGQAAWLALEWRAKEHPGETVLVLGASGALGRVAIQAARLLGAGRVVGADRNADRLASIAALGCDATVVLGDDSDGDHLPAELLQAAQGGADVVIDLLWGHRHWLR